jgi:tetratricopeptide (TPR) repeat protein
MQTRFFILRHVAAVALALCGICATALGQTNDPEKARLTKPAEPSGDLAERIDRLIEQLGDPRFTVRERAQQELAEIGGAAFDALTAAQGHRDLEVVARARLLVQSMRIEVGRDTDTEEIRKLLADYDAQTDAERRRRISVLAAKSQSEGLAPLCRVVRYERSVMLSKQAAVMVMDQKRPLPAEWAERTRIILEETRGSKRHSVLWLRAYAEFPGKPDETLAGWKALLDAEESQQQNASTLPEQRAVLAGLLRQQVMMLLERQQREEALVAMRRMLDVDNGDSQSLSELIEWVIRQEAWPLVDEVAQRLDRQLNGNPYLMYLVARAYDLRGDSKRAEELAQKALTQQGNNVDQHFTIGYRLQQQGMMKWAEQEYRAAIESGAEGTFDEMAYGMLGELLGDQQRYKEAADILDELVKKMTNRPRGRRNRALERNADQVQARMHFFRGKQFAANKQTAEQRKHLEQALRHDPTEADVLIALYRVEEMDDLERKKVRERIDRAATLFEQRLTAAPDDATAMNQFAWLVGNTAREKAETDAEKKDEAARLEKAIRYSERSVELARPEQQGGYLDTLAHCYAAKKDYETALKHQTRAVELEPHSGEIRRAFERFKRLREEQSAKAQ